jgi:hypothetical protein
MYEYMIMSWYKGDASYYDIAPKVPRITHIEFREVGDIEEVILQSNTTGINKTIATFRIVRSFRERGDRSYKTRPVDGSENTRLVFAFYRVPDDDAAVLRGDRTENDIETKTSTFVLIGKPLIREMLEFLKPPSPDVSDSELPKIKIPKGQTDSLTEEEITDGMRMVDFNKEREERNRYYTKKSFKEGVQVRDQNPWTREPIKPDTVVNYIAEIDPNMPVVGGRARGARRGTRRRTSRRRTLRRKQVRGTKTY